MRRLNGIDAYMLYSETPRTPNHTLKIGVYDPSDDPTQYSFAWMKEMLAARLHRLPPFRWRLVPTPLGIHHPVFIEDPDFDLERHVFRVGVPAPGTIREMCEMISQIASVPLDRTRPLWEVWILEGMEDGKVGYVAKTHHALADGVASAELLGQFFTAEPDEEVPSEDPPWRPEAIPGWWKGLGRALIDMPRTALTEIPPTLRALRRARAQKAELARSGAPLPPKASDAPPAPFSRLITPHRAFACKSFALDDVKEIRAAFGTTINDVVLAAVSGALRRYLLERDELPGRPLVGSVPFSIRTEAERGTYGNRVTTGYVSLRTDIDDPVKCLRACHEAASATKAYFRATEGAHLANWLEITHPSLTKLTGGVVRAREGRGSLAGNVVVSNVPGPRHSLYLDKHRLAAFYSIGQIFDGTGLNLTVWSYTDQLNLSVLACRELVPDVWELVEHFERSLDELLEAARRNPASP